MRGSLPQDATNDRNIDRNTNQSDGCQSTEQQEDINRNIQRENTTQEDMNFANNDYVGLPITEEKGENVYRLQCGNANGLSLDANGGEFGEYCDEVNRFQSDTFGVTELNLDTTKHHIKNQLHDTSRKCFINKCQIVYSSSTIPSENNFKPGGTLTATVGNMAGRVTGKGSDPLGRWSYQQMSCKNGRTFFVITAYQVATDEIVNAGKKKSMTSTAQQTSILRRQGQKEKPREAFVKDLRKEIKLLKKDGAGILLIGDFNEELEVSYDGMTKLISDMNFTDIMWHETGCDDFATYARGKTRIDYCIADDWIAEQVLQACYEPFGLRHKGDHRLMVIDFDAMGLFGNPTYRLDTPVTRDFTCKDTKNNRIFIEHLYQDLNDRQFGNRLAALKDNWDPVRGERLDCDHKRAIKYASKNCKKKPNLAYTREISKLRREKNVMKHVVSSVRLGINFDQAIDYQVKLGYTEIIPSTIEECQKRCRQCRQELRKMAKDASKKREAEQQQDLAEAKLSGDKSKIKAIKFRIQAEKTKKMYAKLRRCRGNRKTGLTRIKAPLDKTDTDYANCKEWISVSVPKELEERIRQRNQKHFGQAEGTFPTVPPFSEWVDWGASTHVADLLLEGNMDTSILDELAQDLAKFMKKKTTLDGIDGILTVSEWEGKIKSWPEQTSTSPSGFNLTYSKALVSPHDLNINTPEGKELEEKRQQLIQWQVDLLNLAISNCYSYERWKTVVNVMIMKDPSDLRIHRLRVIHLYEHDYTLLLAIKWRQLIQFGTKEKLINQGQYGGVPGRDAVMPTIIEELQYEIGRASKRPLIHLDYDATACYDRIIMNFGGLIARGFGQDRRIVFINGKTLEEAKYVLKTQMGVSESFYKNCVLFPIYGSGQGAGNSPGIWCCVSSVIFDLYEEKANGATFHSPDGKITVRVYMIGFVDDTSGSTNDFLAPTQLPLNHYAQLATSDAQRWNDVLHLTGGSLNTQKCSYHFVTYNFTISGLPIPKAGIFDPIISIKFNTDTQVSNLKQLSSMTTHKYLGVFKAPGGKETKGDQILQNKNTVHAKTVAKSPFNRTDTWSYYHAIYLPSMTYTFPSTHHTTSTLTEMEKEIKKAVLPKYGFNRNTPNAVVYGHSDFGGVEMRRLEVEQGIARLYYLMMSLRSEGIPNDLARIAISWAQLIAGINKSIFINVTLPLPHLSPMKWIPAIRTFLAKTECTLEMEENYVPPLQRENDCFIMMSALTDKFTSGEKEVINACRLFKGVSLFSECVDAEGMYVRKDMFEPGKPLDTFKGLMPYQDNPSMGSWYQWKRLMKTFCEPRSLKLLNPLGRWFVTGDASHRQHRAYYHHSTKATYLWKNKEYEVLQRQINGYVFEGTTVDSLPEGSVPVDLHLSGDHITRGPASREYPKIVSKAPNNFSSFVDGLDTWERSLLSGLQLNHDIFMVMDHLNTATEDNGIYIYSTSDGSAPDFVGSFGWSCKLSTGQFVASNKGPACGYRTTSFRAEAYGLLLFLVFLIRAVEYTGQHLPKRVKLHTDSKSVLEKVLEMATWPFYYSNATMAADWDVLQAIVFSLSQFDVKPQLIHVKGHQDDDIEYADLSLAAQLNVDADHLAGSFEYQAHQDPSKTPLIRGNAVNLHSKNGTISSNYRKNIRKMFSYPIMVKYLCERNHWTQTHFDYMDWHSHGISIRKHYSKKHFVTKYIHDWLPLGKLLQHYKPHYSSKCPACDHMCEDRSHFLRCTNRRSWHHDLLKDLRYFFTKHPTRPALVDILQDAIRQWLTHDEVIIAGYPPLYDELIGKQRCVGWEQIFLGRFVEDWKQLQHEFLMTQPRRKKKHSGLTWITGVTTIIWKHVHDQWLLRNSQQHGVTAEEREAKLLIHAQLQTEALYDYKDSVLPRDHSLFYKDLDEHLSYETTSRGLRQWITTWEPVLLQSVTDALTFGTTHMRSIATYMTRRVTTPSNKENNKEKDN